MSSFATKWPVLETLTVGADDVDDDGALTPDARARLFGAVREVYLRGCSSLADASWTVEDEVATPGGEPVEAPGEVTVSVAAVEIFPDRFTMHVRMRPGSGGDGIAAHGSCDLVVEGGVSNEIRDDLIAQAHAASHYH